MDLSQLKFTVDTSELDRAGVAIGNIVTNIGKLDKAARDQARAEATLAKAAKDSAKANLDNAKAQDVKVKSTLAVEQANQKVAAILERNNLLAQKEARAIAEAEDRKVKAVEAAEAKKAKAREDAAAKTAKAEQAAMAAMAKKAKAEQDAITASTEKLAGILQRQKDILEFQTQGFSKGQSSVLAYGKSAGLAAADISELGRVLETQRKLMGGDPFDKSLSGLKSLQNQYTELKESVRQYATDSNLTAKQTRELARDKERLIEKMKVEGASFLDIRKAIRAHNDEYVSLAASYNKMTSAEDAVIKGRKDAVNATNYLTQADQRMAAALNTSNASFDKAGTDSLVRYESALRKSGLAQDVVSTKLATYKSQLMQVQAQEQKRAEQHLTRAISPQIMDIGVSLYSGQNPMTVLIQQSGQLVDLFQLSGVEASKLGDAMRKSFYSMVPAIATVTKGLTGLVFGVFYDAGKGMTDFISKTIGANKAIQHTDDLLYLVGGRAVWFSKIIHGAGTVLAAGFGVGVFAIVAGLGALAVGLKQVITENNDLAKAFALSGASIGLSHAQIIGYVKTLANSGATTGQATEALVAMAKAGTFTSKEILLVSDSAIQMQKGFGIAIEDTVKQFAKLKEKPVEALLEIAKSSGMVGPEIIKMVQELERAGKTTDAASLAMKSYADVNRQRIGEMKEDYNGFALFLVELGQGIKQFFSDSFKALFLSTSPSRQLENQLSSVRDQIKEINTFGSFGRGDELKALKEQERILQSRISATVRLQGEQDKIKLANVESAKYEEAGLKIRKNALDAIDKEAGKTQTLAEFRKSFVDEKLKEAAKEKSIDVEKLRLNTDLTKLLEKQADIEFKKNKKKDPSENYYATLMREATNNTLAADNATQGLTKSELKLLEVKSDPRFEKLTAAQRSEVTAKYETAIAIERLVKVEKERAKLDEDALESAIKVIEKNDEIAKSYENARVAAAEYLDTLRLQASREKDGIGKGTAYRSDQSGLNGIENKFSTKKSALAKSKASLGDYWYEQELVAAQSTYDEEVAIYRQSVADKLAAQGDWTNGASEALANYLSETQNVAKSTEDMFSKAFKGMEDALVSFVKTGKLDFASLADSIITDLIRIQVQQSVMPGLSAGLNAGASWVASLFNAKGNAFDGPGNVQMFANGGAFTNKIVDSPTLFPLGAMGEAGPEAIMPLTRGSDGNLGVRASGSTSGNSIIVNVIESPGNGGQQSRRTENGVDILDVFVEKVKSSIATDINRGSGAVPNAMASTYGLNRVAGAY